MATGPLASSTISHGSKSMPPIQRLFSKSPSIALRADDLTKAGVVQINGTPLKTSENDDLLEREQIYRNLIGELNANGPQFPHADDAMRMFGPALDHFMLKGAEGVITEPLKDSPLKPVGEPVRAVNLVPLKNGILIHTRLSYAHVADQQGKVIQFETQPALEIHLRHIVEFKRDDSLVERAVNKWQGNGKETHTATSYFVSADAVTPSRELRDSLVTRSNSILDRLIDFFAQLFDAPRYEVYAPNRGEETLLYRSMPTLPHSIGRPAAEEPLPELRKPELIPEDQRVRISHVHRAAIHKDTIPLDTKNRLLDTAQIKLTADLDFKKQRTHARSTEREDKLVTFSQGNTQRLMLKSWRAGNERVVTELNKVSGLNIAFKNPNEFGGLSDPLDASSSQAPRDEPMTFYVGNKFGSPIKTSEKVKGDLISIQKAGGPVVTYALIQKIWPAADAWAAVGASSEIGGDEKGELTEQLAFSIAHLFDEDSVTSLFNVLAAVNRKYYEVNDSQFGKVLPGRTQPQFLVMASCVSFVHNIHKNRLPVDGGMWPNPVFDHQPENVNEADVIGVATLLGLEG